MGNEITVHVRQIAGSTSEATLRTHKVLVDRPVAKGGADQGPMGGELFLAGLGGCFMPVAARGEVVYLISRR